MCVIASGNVLAIYENEVLDELVIYGSSRLGSYNAKTDQGKRTLGNKKYELSNHLGNVLAVISDNKIGIGNNGVADYYEPLVISESDYYPFGMAMKERSFSNEEYRFGFNTQEKSTELGEDTYTAEFWQYDSKIARRWNVDPIDKPWESSYLVNNGNPISMSDPRGDDTRIKKKTRKGKTRYKIKYRGVLIDKTGKLSRKEIREYRKAINQQLRETFTDEDENASWKIKVRLRVGKNARRSRYRESSVNLVENGYMLYNDEAFASTEGVWTAQSGSSVANNTLDAYVNINKLGAIGDELDSKDEIGRKGSHEIAHTMGIPHIIAERVYSFETKKRLSFEEISEGAIVVYDPKLIPNPFEHSNNLMQPGYLPKFGEGKKVTSSQIERIYYSYQNNIINNYCFDLPSWGEVKSDKDVYRFYYIKGSKLFKTQPSLKFWKVDY